MRIFLGIFWVVLVEAALKFTTTWSNIVTGVPFVITWSGYSGSVILTLENGTTTNPFAVNVIASAITSNSYAWTPGNKATVGSTFFINITDTAGNSDVGDKFVVLASSSSSSTKKTSSTSSVTATKTSGSTITTTPAAAVTTGSTDSSAQSTSSTEAGLDTSAGSSGLSSGAKAGLGVGVALGVCLVGGLAVFAFFWRKKRMQRAAGADPGASTGDGKAELPGSLPTKQVDPVEMAVEPPKPRSDPVRYELA